MMTNVDHLKVEGMKPLICKKDQKKTVQVRGSASIAKQCLSSSSNVLRYPGYFW